MTAAWLGRLPRSSGSSSTPPSIATSTKCRCCGGEVQTRYFPEAAEGDQIDHPERSVRAGLIRDSVAQDLGRDAARDPTAPPGLQGGCYRVPSTGHRRSQPGASAGISRDRLLLSVAMGSVPPSSSAHPATWKFGYAIYHAESRAQWRAWLDANHDAAPRVWLCSWRAVTGRPACPYPDVVQRRSLSLFMPPGSKGFEPGQALLIRVGDLTSFEPHPSHGTSW